MNTSTRQVPLGFTAETVPEGQHICYIFNDDTERERTIGKFLTSGLEEGEKVLGVIDRMSTDAYTKLLENLGFNVQGRDKAFTLSEALSVYCPSGNFSSERMLKVIANLYPQAREEGYVGARVTGEMTWALRGDQLWMDELVEYECLLNEVLPKNPATACCQYDARRFDGGTIMDMLSVHPMMIVRGQVVKNPYYIEPQTFLKEFRARRNESQDG